MTDSILMMAPRAIRLHMEPIISISEYRPTPKVAAKKPRALTVMEGMDAGQGRPDGLMLIPAPERSFCTGGHQNGIVHRGAQLDGTDADGGDKGQGRAGIEGNAQIDEDGELNDRHQDDRQGDGFQHQGDDDENRRDGNDVDHLKIPGR